MQPGTTEVVHQQSLRSTWSASVLTNHLQTQEGDAQGRQSQTSSTPGVKLYSVKFGDGMIAPFERATPALALWLSRCGAGCFVTAAQTDEKITRVVVGTPEPLDESTKAALDTILNNHGMGRPLYITDRATRGDDDTATRRENTGYQDTVNCGASVGVSGSDTAGTFGGYLRFEDDDSYYGITCHHVITRSTEPVRTQIAIHQPGDSDVTRDLENVIGILRIKSDILERMTATNNQRELVGLEPRDTAPLEAEVHSMKRKVECKSEEAKKEARFGVLWQTSGLVTAKWGPSEPRLTHSIDWALFRIDAHHRLGENAFPGDEEFKSDMQPHLNAAEMETAVMFGTRFLYTGVELKTALKKSDIVAMVSKNSGTRVGRYSRIKAVVMLDDSPEPTSEHVIMSLDGRSMFSVKGDSGSWIINCSGKVIGMLIGGNEKTGCTYFTPIDLLVDSVEKTTGKKLRWLSAESGKVSEAK
jgi:hypothetical protein